MRIKLLYVPRLYAPDKFEYTTRHSYIPPLGIALLSSALKTYGHSVSIDDLDIKVYTAGKPDLSPFDSADLVGRFIARGHDERLESIARAILGLTDISGYDLVGLSVCGQHNSTALAIALVLSKLIKDVGLITVIGGLDDDSLIPMKDVVRFCAYAITQLGEEPFINLCDDLEKGRQPDVSRVFSQAKMGGSDFRIREGRIFCPDFDGLPLDLYRYSPEKERSHNRIGVSGGSILLLPYLSSFGCPKKCAFCSESANSYFVTKKPEEVSHDLSYLMEKYHTRQFFFLDSSVNPTPDRGSHLIDAIKDLGIRWSSCVNLSGLTQEIVERMARSGAVRAIYGLETGSQKLVDSVGKGFRVNDAGPILKKAHEVGIWNEVELICGLPYEENTDVLATADFIRRNAAYLDACHVNKFHLKTSLLLSRPGHYGLSNIRLQGKNPVKTRDAPEYEYSFDEISGLAWGDKVRQIDDSFRQITDAVSRYVDRGQNLYIRNEDSALLFYLFENLQDKNKVRSAIYVQLQERSKHRG